MAERLLAAPAYLATVRTSGAPRVHPVTPIFTEAGLYLFMEPTSPKAADLRERDRFALHNGVPDNAGTGGEASVSGTGRSRSTTPPCEDGRRRHQLRTRRPLRPVRAATHRGALQRVRRRRAARASTVARMTKPLADRHDLIRVHGARVNNLKDVSIEIPKRRLTVFTGRRRGISPTSSSCSACSTASSTRASRCSSSSIIRPSWRTPTGSSTSVPARATTAAASCSRARPPTSSRPVRTRTGEHLSTYVGG